ncbi:MAG: DUF1841 family protein [Acidiferrobacteraceae bacterium]
MFSDRGELRGMFFQAWKRFQHHEPLDAAQALVVQVALRHPEYHEILERADAYRDHDYLPDAGVTNPFLHLGLHIALEEQIGMNRPSGIRDCYQRLCHTAGDEHQAQHRMIDCLAETLWQAERTGHIPDEESYLRCIERL